MSDNDDGMSATDDEEAMREARRFLRAVRSLTPEQRRKMVTYLERLEEDDHEVTEQEFRNEISRILTGHGLQ